MFQQILHTMSSAASSIHNLAILQTILVRIHSKIRARGRDRDLTVTQQCNFYVFRIIPIIKEPFYKKKTVLCYFGAIKNKKKYWNIEFSG